VEGEKKMCGTVMGCCYSSRPVKVHERKLGQRRGPYCYGHCCIRVVTVHTGCVLFTRSITVLGGYCSYQVVLFTGSDTVLRTVLCGRGMFIYGSEGWGGISIFSSIV
jgi:hypothetical protein